MNKKIVSLLLALAFVSGSCAMERDEQDPKESESQEECKVKEKPKAKQKPIYRTDKFGNWRDVLKDEEKPRGDTDEQE